MAGNDDAARTRGGVIAMTVIENTAGSNAAARGAQASCPSDAPLSCATLWLIRRHRVRPNLAAAVAELAGLGEARHG